MGEYADDAIDRGMDDIIRYDNYRDSPDKIKYEEGLIDELGFERKPDLKIPIDPFNWKK